MPKSKDLKILEAEIREIRKDIVDSMRFFLEKIITLKIVKINL